MGDEYQAKQREPLLPDNSTPGVGDCMDKSFILVKQCNVLHEVILFLYFCTFCSNVQYDGILFLYFVHVNYDVLCFQRYSYIFYCM